ncbi:MAG: hypothetical protein WBG42_13690 [Cryomorphaceae bacterium]
MSKSILNQPVLNENPHPENDSSDEISELEKLQATLKRERVAWAKLLENLKELRTKNNKENPDQNSNPIKP